MAREYTIDGYDLMLLREGSLTVPYSIVRLTVSANLLFQLGDFSLLLEKSFSRKINKLDSLRLLSGSAFETHKAQKDAEEALLALKSISQFIMSSSVLSNGFLLRLAKKSAYFSSTKEIHLSGIYLEPRMAVKVVKALSQTTYFEKLHLWDVSGIESSGSFFYYLGNIRKVVLGNMTNRVNNFLCLMKAKKLEAKTTRGGFNVPRSDFAVFDVDFGKDALVFLRYISNCHLQGTVNFCGPSYIESFFKGSLEFKVFIRQMTNTQTAYPSQHGKYIFYKA